jgi:hypothetical protein
MPLIKGKVAGVVHDRAIVINRGTADGVCVGMKFTVKLMIPDIVDPDNPENIFPGSYFLKGQVQVTQVYPSMAYCDILPKGYTPVQLGIVNYPKVENPLITPEKWAISKNDEVEQIVEEDNEEKDKQSLDSFK